MAGEKSDEQALKDRIADQVHRLRRGAGWSQEELGARAGLSRDTIRRLENKKLSPSLATLGSIAKALSIELGTFFDEQAPSKDSRAAVAVLHGRIAGGGLDPGCLRVLNELVELLPSRRRGQR